MIYRNCNLSMLLSSHFANLVVVMIRIWWHERLNSSKIDFAFPSAPQWSRGKYELRFVNCLVELQMSTPFIIFENVWLLLRIINPSQYFGMHPTFPTTCFNHIKSSLKRFGSHEIEPPVLYLIFVTCIISKVMWLSSGSISPKFDTLCRYRFKVRMSSCLSCNRTYNLPKCMIIKLLTY